MMSAIYRIRRRASGHAQDEDGFTMVEVVIAIFIFAMVITGVGVGMSSALNLTRQNKNRSIAANLASQQMDTVRSTEFTTLDAMTYLAQPTTVAPTPVIEGVAFTITQNTRWIRKNATGATAGPCQSPPTATNPLAYIAVTTMVTWNDMHGVLPVQTNTVISPPVGVYDQTEGHMRVTVLDAAGQPIPGTIVSISNPLAGVSANSTTGADGCVFFAYQPTGAYTVTLSSAVGQVDGQGSSTPVQNVTVKSASTSTVQFLFDTAASLTLTLSPITAGYTVPTTVPVSLGNTALQPTGVLSYSSPTGLSRTIPSLFPYSSGFQAWAGSCSDADPQGVDPGGSAYYPDAVRDPETAMTPGGTSTVLAPAVVVPSTSLRFRRSAGQVTNHSVTATHFPVAPNDVGCPTPETYVLATGLTIPISASGVAVNVSLPYGTWTITVKNGSGSVRGTEQITLSPLNATWPVTPAVLNIT